MHEYVADTITSPEHPNRRALIVLDTSPTEPYDDGGSPILRLDISRNYGEWRAEQITSITSHLVDDRIVTAAGRWGSDTDVFERYLRIFHGTTKVEWHDSRSNGGDYVYATFDTAAWREEMGLTDEYVAAHPDINLASMTEWIAYVNGDCYGIVVEEKHTWKRTDSDDTIETWDTIDSVFGFYGDSDSPYITNEARGMLA